MATLSLRVPEELEARLDEEGKRQNLSRSELVRAALEEFVDRRERERVLASFAAEARAAYADPKIRREALEIAAEALVTDNEALDAAERGPRRPAPSHRSRRSSPRKR